MLPAAHSFHDVDMPYVDRSDRTRRSRTRPNGSRVRRGTRLGDR